MNSNKPSLFSPLACKGAVSMQRLVGQEELPRIEPGQESQVSTHTRSGVCLFQEEEWGNLNFPWVMGWNCWKVPEEEESLWMMGTRLELEQVISATSVNSCRGTVLL